jgi:hypothetical protein
MYYVTIGWQACNFTTLLRSCCVERDFMCHDYTRSTFNFKGRRGSVAFVLDSWKKDWQFLTKYSVR